MTPTILLIQYPYEFPLVPVSLENLLLISPILLIEARSSCTMRYYISLGVKPSEL